MSLYWLAQGGFSKRFCSTAQQRCYFAVETRVVFTTGPLLSKIKKDVLPAHHHNRKTLPVPVPVLISMENGLLHASFFSLDEDTLFY